MIRALACSIFALWCPGDGSDGFPQAVSFDRYLCAGGAMGNAHTTPTPLLIARLPSRTTVGVVFRGERVVHSPHQTTPAGETDFSRGLIAAPSRISDGWFPNGSLTGGSFGWVHMEEPSGEAPEWRAAAFIAEGDDARLVRWRLRPQGHSPSSAIATVDAKDARRLAGRAVLGRWANETFALWPDGEWRCAAHAGGEAWDRAVEAWWDSIALVNTE